MSLNTPPIKLSRKDWYIDIRKVFKDKNPKLYPWMPNFIFRFFEWLLCLPRINNLIYSNRGNSGIKFAENLVKESHVEHSISYLSPLDSHERYIFACNHPLGGLDAMTFASQIQHFTSNFKFVVNDILMNLKGLDQIFLPINKHGSQAKENTKLINDAYHSDSQIIVFPAGLVSRKQQGVIKDLRWHKNFIKKAIQSKRNIVPVHIIAKNSSFFYNFALWRERLGIKVNLEMLLLPKEFFRFDGKKIEVIVGKPIAYSDLSNNLTQDEWAKKIKNMVYSMCPKSVENKDTLRDVKYNDR